ncbi:MAG TPA: cytochrome P450 [Pseudonocardiaceae bacterium]|jgi:cytochrome P450
MTTTSDLPNYPFDKPAPLDPPTEWAELRDTCPVARVRMPSGDEVSLISRYQDVRDVLTDGRFTRDLNEPGAARLADTEDGGIFSRPSAPDVNISDGDGHRRWRRLLSGSFTMKKMAQWRPTIQSIADELVDDMIAKGSPADLMADFGLPLPVAVICALLGAPSEDKDKFAEWSRISLTLTRYTQAEVNRARREFAEYVSALVVEKRANPGDDLLSELTLISDAEDGRLSHGELVATGMGLLLAGHETTSNMIGKMTGILLGAREHYEAVIADPELIPGTIEEVLRMDTNGGIGIPRYITEDIEVGGCPVGKGTTLMMLMAAANRDEARFAEPDTFDPNRANGTQHLTFGAGPHFCVGQPLARVELQVALGTMTTRLPNLQLRDGADALPMRKGSFGGGFENVWVTW